MKVYLVFYTDNKFRVREEKFLKQSKIIGFDDVFNYRKELLEKTDFYMENKEILDMSVGSGYWLWKPYIILDAMKEIEDNDVVFYIDAGDEIINIDIINKLKNHMIDLDYIVTDFSGKRYSQKITTKRDCFILMNCDEEKYHNALQIEAGTLAFKKTKFVEDFLNEWLFYCKNKNILTDIPNIHGENLEGFMYHRHDQSIISNLIIKYNMKYDNTIFPMSIGYNFFMP